MDDLLRIRIDTDINNTLTYNSNNTNHTVKKNVSEIPTNQFEMFLRDELDTLGLDYDQVVRK